LIRLNNGSARQILAKLRFVYIRLHSFTFVYIRLHSFTFVYIRLHSFTFVYIRLHSFTFVYIRLHLFAFIYICLHSFAFVCICLHFLPSFTFVYILEIQNFCVILHISLKIWVMMDKIQAFNLIGNLLLLDGGGSPNPHPPSLKQYLYSWWKLH